MTQQQEEEEEEEWCWIRLPSWTKKAEDIECRMVACIRHLAIWQAVSIRAEATTLLHYTQEEGPLFLI